MTAQVASEPMMKDVVFSQMAEDSKVCYEYRLNESEIRKRQVFINTQVYNGADFNVDNIEFLRVGRALKRGVYSGNNRLMRAFTNYCAMRDDYSRYFADKEQSAAFVDVFGRYAVLLAQLPIRRSFVDFSISRQVVEFSLKLNGKFFVTVNKPLNTIEDNDALVTISRQHKLIYSNLVNANKLIATIKDVVS